MTRSLAPRFLFGFLCLAVALVSLRLVALGLEAAYPAMAHHFATREASLAIHVVAAALALALLPVQFAARLRARRPGLHRWTGRAYAVLVLAGGLSGLHLARFAATGAVAATGFTLLALIWIAVTANAVIAAMARDIPRHRRWMLLSAALTFAAVTLRLLLPAMLAAGINFDTAYPIVAWLCWVPNLAVAALFAWRRPAPAPALTG